MSAYSGRLGLRRYEGFPEGSFGDRSDDVAHDIHAYERHARVAARAVTDAAKPKPTLTVKAGQHLRKGERPTHGDFLR